MKGGDVDHARWRSGAAGARRARSADGRPSSSPATRRTRRAAGAGAARPARRRGRRRRRARLRGRRRRPAARRHRAARHHGLGCCASTGTPAHSSQIFRADIGRGAIYEAARILAAFHDSLSSEPVPDLQSRASLVGGTTVELDRATGAAARAFGKDNVIAESTLVSGDLRTLSPEQLERAPGRRCGAIVAASLAAHRAPRSTFNDGYPPLAAVRRAIARCSPRFDAASRDLGHGPVTADRPGARRGGRHLVHRRADAGGARRARAQGDAAGTRSRRRPTCGRCRCRRRGRR